MKLKNYTKEGQKLPLFGIGPYLIYGIGLLTAICIVLFSYVLKTGILTGSWIWIFRITGGILIVLGFVIWYIGAIKSDMDESITGNKLKTDGIYARVRNPMYSGWWILLTGISLMWHNIYMIPVFFVNWAIMTIVLKNTEEKWLTGLYGAEYAAYKKRVNRFIPVKKMGLIRNYMNQTRKPEGKLGEMMIKGMNSGHAKMADCKNTLEQREQR